MTKYIEKGQILLRKFTVSQESEYARGWNDGLEAVAQNAPDADVVPAVRGRWVLKETVHFGLKEYKCSKCSDDEYWKKYYCRGNETYCPNCGADMRGEST